MGDRNKKRSGRLGFGGFGANTFATELDGSQDSIIIKSDQFLVNPLDGTSMNNRNGERTDVIGALDPFDRIILDGVGSNLLSFREVSHQNILDQFNGIGIFAGDSLEAIYVVDNFSVDSIRLMTSVA